MMPPPGELEGQDCLQHPQPDIACAAEALRGLDDRLGVWVQRVSPDAVAELKRAMVALADAEAAVNTARALGDEDVSADHLKGNAWVEMVRAAARFVQSIDGARRPSALSHDDRCALCWQQLDANAQSRLDRFQRHLEGAAQQAKEQAVRQRDELVSLIESASISISSGAM